MKEGYRGSERRERGAPTPWRDGGAGGGARYYPDPLSLTVHDALDFCSFVCFFFDFGTFSLSESRRRTSHEVD